VNCNSLIRDAKYIYIYIYINHVLREYHNSDCLKSQRLNDTETSAIWSSNYACQLILVCVWPSAIRTDEIDSDITFPNFNEISGLTYIFFVPVNQEER